MGEKLIERYYWKLENLLNWRYDEERDDRNKFDINMAYEILKSQGIPFLMHRISAKPDGLYDDRTKCGGSWVEVDETKIADISLKLL